MEQANEVKTREREREQGFFGGKSERDKQEKESNVSSFGVPIYRSRGPSVHACCLVWAYY